MILNVIGERERESQQQHTRALAFQFPYIINGIFVSVCVGPLIYSLVSPLAVRVYWLFHLSLDSASGNFVIYRGGKDGGGDI